MCSKLVNNVGLPNNDSKQIRFFDTSDKLIKQCNTRYYYSIKRDENPPIAVLSSEMLKKDKYKLEKSLCDGFGEVIKHVVNNFGAALTGSFKALGGSLYTKERDLHKLPKHISGCEETCSINFDHGDGSAWFLDFQPDLKTHLERTSNNIFEEKNAKLNNFKSKQLHVSKAYKRHTVHCVKNCTSENVLKVSHKRVINEAQDRDNDDSSEDESTAKNPNSSKEQDTMPDYDSDIESSYTEGDSKSEQEKKAKKDKEEQQQDIGSTDKPDKRSENKKKRKIEGSKRKRAYSAFTIWLNEIRESIKADNPGLDADDIEQKAEELWIELQDKTEWEVKAVKSQEEHEATLNEYVAGGGCYKNTSDDDDDNQNRPRKKPVSKVEKTIKAYLMSKGSKENIGTEETFSDDENT